MAAHHSVATADQAYIEKRALWISRHPRVRAAYGEVAEYWLDKARPSADMRRCFEAAFEEVMFCAAVWSLNQDAQRPRVTTITRLAHELDGERIPGSRYGLDNPDSIYRTIPIDGSEQYLIKGRVAERRLAENYFTLWDREGNTVSVLNGNDLQLNPDRSFTIIVDSQPAAGRANHIQSSPDAHQFYIRDVLLDWSADVPNELAVEKIGEPGKPALSDDEQAELTVRFMWDYADNTMRWNRQALQLQPNVIAFSIDRDTDGALRNQFYSLGHFRIRDDEALVLTLHAADAGYFIVPVTNLWGTSNDIVHRNGSLNRQQAVANQDGTYTFVVSLADPGVHNWVDPCDMHDGIITARWAEFPGGRPSGRVAVESQLVRLERLREILPVETRWITPEQRRQQLAERARGYLRRLAD